LQQAEEVFAAGGTNLPDIMLLDNMSTDLLRQCVGRRNLQAPNVVLEASGGITLETVGAVAATGVDRISTGMPTHAAAWLDVALDWQ
jgi:nicotinate-nucleotide pyrophosphorylase (carboxylating)